MEDLKFSCDIENSSNHVDLGIECWLDNHCFYDALIPTGTTSIEHNFAEDENQHLLKFVFKNKNNSHTVIDEQSNIISDVLITVKDICFDNINIDQLFFEHSKYKHNFNNAQHDHVVESFYGVFGCNGTVEFEFYTPFYMWLLESM